jgi:hypothetical protein
MNTPSFIPHIQSVSKIYWLCFKNIWLFITFHCYPLGPNHYCFLPSFSVLLFIFHSSQCNPSICKSDYDTIVLQISQCLLIIFSIKSKSLIKTLRTYRIWSTDTSLTTSLYSSLHSFHSIHSLLIILLIYWVCNHFCTCYCISWSICP